jgi:hypothetical protein
MGTICSNSHISVIIVINNQDKNVKKMFIPERDELRCEWGELFIEFCDL